jgi:uncharacterized membrane protein YfcA
MSTVLEQNLFATSLALVAAAYAAVGQGGATGYIALMSLAGFDAEVIRTTALTLNLLVSTLGVVLFAKAGLLKPRNVYLFAVLGVPCSVLGGATHLSPSVYHPVVGVLLLIAAWQMARSARRSQASAKDNTPPVLASLVAGAAIGFVAGVTGIGGGILLAPLTLMLNWADARETAAASAAFNLLNSAAALVGLWLNVPSLSFPPLLWLAAAVCGGAMGALLGVRKLPPAGLRYALAFLLVVAGARMLVSS